MSLLLLFAAFALGFTLGCYLGYYGKVWLIRYGGWEATHAQEVAELAQRILERRKLRKGRPHWRKNILEIWREEAAKSA